MHGTVSRRSHNGKRIPRSNVLCLFIGFSFMVVLGIVFTMVMIPKESNRQLGKEPQTSSFNEEVAKWLPISMSTGNNKDGKFWTPIDLEVSQDSVVVLCQLDFKTYSETPHKYSMFRDLVTISQCTGRNRRRERLTKALEEVNSNPQLIKNTPTAFVFHESRVGSTLVANELGSDPNSLVFSESPPPANALLHCTECSREQQIKLFRDVVLLMSSSTYHQRVFFKFQSITTTRMEIALEAFPDTPWIFIYRSPVQTMMSHLDPEKSSIGAPCLRSMRNPPDEVSNVVASYGSGSPSKELWCAAHLSMLCMSAVRNYEKYALYSQSNTTLSLQQRGMLVNYESLPGIISILLLPLFGVEPSKDWLSRMESESTNYSKGKMRSKIFTGDSTDKESRATDAIRSFGNDVLGPVYDKLESLSTSAFRYLSLDDYIDRDKVTWNKFKSIPSALSDLSKRICQKFRKFDQPSLSRDELQNKHSNIASKIPYEPWSPFASTHSSRPYEIVNCPIKPEPGYPKTYSIVDMLNNWGTDSTEIPQYHYDPFCHFDYQNETELRAAFNYRDAEVPFVIYNFPQFDEIVNKWNDHDYVLEKLGNKLYRTETSETNHFMYWRGASPLFRNKDGSRWKPPTKVVTKTYRDWLELAVKGQNMSLEDRTHQYFRVSSDTGNNWLFKELPFFQPKKSLFIVDPREQRGIHCRFGMRSVIAEAHFDGSRNFVAMLSGLRRWVMAHPNQCTEMYMLSSDHPSGRHSEIDWSKPDYVKYPKFAGVRANEVILQPGDILYVPTFWIHYIISLNVNMQCNTRSGKSNGYDEVIKKCGF